MIKKTVIKLAMCIISLSLFFIFALAGIFYCIDTVNGIVLGGLLLLILLGLIVGFIFPIIFADYIKYYWQKEKEKEEERNEGTI
jgi:preprotein translocase subunit SecF